MNKNKRILILQRFYKENPHPITELNYSSPFELLIAVILSARSKDTSVNKVTSELYKVANTPQDIIKLGTENIKFFIKSIGLFNNKAKNIIKTCHIILEKYGGEIPKSKNELELLPGVGSKTANIILNTIFKYPTIAVDTHTFRVCNRTLFASGKNIKLVEKKLLKVVPYKFKIHCHYWFVIHGRYICTARKPRCRLCIIEDLCEYADKNQ